MRHHDKLDDAHAAIKSMTTAQSFAEFRRAFEACLTALRAAGDAIKADLKRLLKQSGRRREVQAFEAWMKQNYDQLENDDPLLAWVKSARNGDLHEGARALVSGFHIDEFDPASIGPPPVEGASLEANDNGLWWVYRLPGGRVTMVPVPLPPRVALSIYCKDPPAAHRGQPVNMVNPLALCQLALAFYEDLAARVHQDWVLKD